MPRSCNICSHQESAEITKAVLAGASNREVVRRFGPGITESGVQRHRRNCLKAPRREPKIVGERGAPADARGTVRFDTNDPKTLVTTTARLVDEALDLLEHAKRGEDHRTALAALREARDGLALLMRAAGMLAGDGSTTINVDARKQGLLMLGRMDEASLRSAIARLTAGADASASDELGEAAIDAEHHVLTP